MPLRDPMTPHPLSVIVARGMPESFTAIGTDPHSKSLTVIATGNTPIDRILAEVAKAEATGIPPKETSWVAKVQQLAGVSGTEVTDDLIDVLTARAIISTTKGRKQPNGKDISGSRRRNVLEALRAEGYTTDEAIRLYEALA